VLLRVKDFLRVHVPYHVDHVSVLGMSYISSDVLQCGDNVKKRFPQFPKPNAVCNLAAVVGPLFR